VKLARLPRYIIFALYDLPEGNVISGLAYSERHGGGSLKLRHTGSL
jgi:hypothetical protein